MKEHDAKYMTDTMEHTGDMEKPYSALKVVERK